MACSCAPQRSMENSRPPLIDGAPAAPAANSSANLSVRPSRCGRASSRRRVRTFWAATQPRVSGESPSSSQRYGSATSTPCSTSTTSSRRASGGAGTAGADPIAGEPAAGSALAGVGLATVVGLLPPGPDLALDGPFRHRSTPYRRCSVQQFAEVGGCRDVGEAEAGLARQPGQHVVVDGHPPAPGQAGAFAGG